MSTSAPQTPLSQTPSAAPPAPFSQAIGRSRCIVLLAVLAVLLVLISLFLQGTMLAVESVWTSWRDLIAGHAQHFRILEAVVFYLIGVGLYSVFISPMNVTVALGGGNAERSRGAGHQRHYRHSHDQLFRAFHPVEVAGDFGVRHRGGGGHWSRSRRSVTGRRWARKPTTPRSRPASSASCLLRTTSSTSSRLTSNKPLRRPRRQTRKHKKERKGFRLCALFANRYHSGHEPPQAWVIISLFHVNQPGPRR